MAKELSFKSTQTPNGVLHTMRITDTTGFTTDFRLFLVRPTADYIKEIGPKHLAKNGTAWQTGRSVSGGLIAWKTTKISKRLSRDAYRMRSVPGGYKGDYVTIWCRKINSTIYQFTRIYWNAGQDGSTLRVDLAYNGKTIHEWTSKTPVKMKKGV